MAGSTLISNRNLRPVTIKSYGEFRILNVGTMEIWDGAELSLIRETLQRLFEEEECRTLGVDMRFVKYVPSGFFGMLCDWHDRGASIRVFGPMSHVKQMLWFSQFFRSIGDEFHELRPSVNDEFSESASKCAQSREPVAEDDSSSTSTAGGSSTVPLQPNVNADLSNSVPLHPVRMET